MEYSLDLILPWHRKKAHSVFPANSSRNHGHDLPHPTLQTCAPVIKFNFPHQGGLNSECCSAFSDKCRETLFGFSLQRDSRQKDNI